MTVGAHYNRSQQMARRFDEKEMSALTLAIGVINDYTRIAIGFATRRTVRTADQTLRGLGSKNEKT